MTLLERRTQEAEDTRAHALARWLVCMDDLPEKSTLELWRKVRQTKIPVGDGRTV